MCIYIYIYLDRERERERERCMHIDIHVYFGHRLCTPQGGMEAMQAAKLQFVKEPSLSLRSLAPSDKL